MTDNTPVRLTRIQAAKFLTEQGFPIAPRYFSKLALPGSGQGPRIDMWFGPRALYLPEDLLEWALSRSRPGDKRAAEAA
jgi:hypothetical protein